MNSIALIITTLFSGLMAGLFYAWSISVTPGIGRINDESYLRAFQSMNRAIINSLFLIVFMGLVVLLIYSSSSFYGTPQTTRFWFILSAAILYIGGVMLITFAGNIPLNNSLEALNIDAMSTDQMAAFRKGFESKWNTLNTIRTVCSSASFLLLILACLQNNN